MTLISKESFEKLTEEEKLIIRRAYNTLQIGLSTGLLEDVSLVEQKAKIKEFENIFGKETLQPEPKIRTWEDVEKECGEEVYSSWGKLGADISASRPSEKIINKCIATLKLSKLIELGYGGMVTEEEWLNEEYPKPVIKCTTDIKPRLYNDEVYDDIQFVAFHTDKQRSEFMSHPENVKLVEQYYMI